MITTATARFVRVSARKARLVLDQIRGKPVSEALAALRFTPRAAARLIEKVLRSAVANAENNHQVRNLDDLRVVGAGDGAHAQELGALDDPGWDQHTLPGVGRPPVPVAESGTLRGMQACTCVMADQLRPVGQPADAFVREHPGCIAGNLPKAGQARRLAMEACHVVEILEGT